MGVSATTTHRKYHGSIYLCGIEVRLTRKRGQRTPTSQIDCYIVIMRRPAGRDEHATMPVGTPRRLQQRTLLLRRTEPHRAIS